MPLVSQWGRVNATLINPLELIGSRWGVANVTLAATYTTGAVPSVYDQTTNTWVTVQPVRWDEASQQWIED